MRHTSRPMFRPFFRPSVAAQVDAEVVQNTTTAPVAARKRGKRPITCCMRISAMSWPLLLAVGILLCCLMAETHYDLPISSMPGYDNNKELQEYVDTPQFPHEIAFDYQKFGLSNQEFYPSMPNYTFYSCLGLNYRHYKSHMISDGFTIYSNWAAGQNLHHTIYLGWGGYVQYENGEKCKDQQCRGLITGWAKVVSNRQVMVETVSTDLDFYQYNGSTRISNCERVDSSGFRSGLLIGVPSVIQVYPTTPVKIQLRFVDTDLRLSAFLMLGFGVAIIVIAASCFFSVLCCSGCNCMLLWFPCFCCEKKAKHSDETEILIQQTTPVVQELPPQTVPQPTYQQQQQYQQPQYQRQLFHQPPQYQQPAVPQMPQMPPQPNKNGFTI